MNRETIRERNIHLPENASETQILAAVDALRDLEPVNRVSLENRKMTVQYNFPALVFSTILKTVDHYLVNAHLSDGLRYSMIAGMEDNERDHLCSYYGWNKYIQDIYVAHSLNTNPAGNRLKKQWLSYRPPDKAGTQPDSQ